MPSAATDEDAVPDRDLDTLHHLETNTEDREMSARLRRAREDDSGFTLTELLVVIVIIGILAAVAVPLYINQQARARDSAAQSDVSGIGREIQTQLVTANPANIRIGMNFDGGTPPTPTNYRIEDASDPTADPEVLGGVSTSVRLLDGTGTAVAAETTLVPLVTYPGVTDPVGQHNWCVAVHTQDGRERDWRYSAQRGLEQGTCQTV